MAVLKVKAGVQPKILHMMAVLSSLAAETTDVPELVVTSGMDSTHGRNSLHYALRALDVRTKTFSSLAMKEYFAQRCREEFGLDYDIVLESIGLDNEHLHIEFDPNRSISDE